MKLSGRKQYFKFIQTHCFFITYFYLNLKNINMDNEEKPIDHAGEEGGEDEQEEVQLIEEEVFVFNMAEDEFYADDHVEKSFPDSSLSKRTFNFFGCYGQSSYKRYNFHHLGEDKFIFATGNTYQILDVTTTERQVFHARDSDGIGSICVHPSKKYFAVGEKGINPCVYIYEYPSLKLYRILRKGTETMYAHIEFSSSGDQIATLGGPPDYTLTVWNWASERVILKAKAFSQEIFRVSFSPFSEGILFTCGQGHLRFWKMAETFTGLKLQCETAKFGQLELSDVSSFYELADGKVISGTEYGTLVLWEGEFVKAHLLLNIENQTPLHGGMVEVILQEGDHFITAGADGYIKWFKVADVDVAEAEEGIEVELVPVKELLIAENEEGKNPAHIVNMVSAGKKWYVQDGRGKIYVVSKETDMYSEIYRFTEGAIMDLVASPAHHYAISLGESGQVKVWDYAKKEPFTEKMFLGRGTCLSHLPQTDANKGRLFAAGFDNGIVRFMNVNTDGLEIMKAFKAHANAIVGVRYSQDLKICVTADVSGDVFFYEMDGHKDVQQFDPLCTLRLPDGAACICFEWSPDDKSLLFGCQNGCVYQVRRPEKGEVDNADSYLWENPEIKTWTIKLMESQMQKNQEKDEAEEERKRRLRLRGELEEEEEVAEVWDPQPIRTLMPFLTPEGRTQFVVSSSGQFGTQLYVGDMEEERPVQALGCQQDALVSFMRLSVAPEGDMVTIGYENGAIELVMDYGWDRRLANKFHDGRHGVITAAVMDKDDAYFLSAAKDGLIYCHQFDKKCAMLEAKKDLLEGVEGVNFMSKLDKERLKAKKQKLFWEENPAVFKDAEDAQLDEAALAITIKNKEPVGLDVLDPSVYSIQQHKLRTEEDHRLELAEKKKTQVRNQIKRLREWFTKTADHNGAQPAHLQAGEDDFQIDPSFFQVLFERNEHKIEETKKEVAWGIEYHTVNLNKLKNKFYDLLEFEKFTVKGISNESHVTTFRVKKMSEFLQQNIESFKQMLENEIIGKDNDDDEEFDEEEEQKDTKQDNAKTKEKEKAAALAAKQKAAQQAALDAKKTEGEKKREQRKREREERKRQIEQLEKKEAMHSGEDPLERKRIDEAMATFGDYKLKQSPDYTVPENQRVNFSKKRQQMVLLEGSIHKLKVDFNQKIQELKVRKKEIIDHVDALTTRIHGINGELGVDDSGARHVHPTIDKDVEYPENYFEISEGDIKQFKRQKQVAAAKAKGKPVPEEEEEAHAAGTQEEDSRTKQQPNRRGAQPQVTALEIEFEEIRKIELQYEKDCKETEIAGIIGQFDEEIKEMQKEKYRLESDLKNAEMKLILFFEELILLKSMEAKDIKLTKRLADCRQDKGKILKSTNEISRQLREKNKEVDEIKEKLAELMERFHGFCDERSDKYEEIRKFFEKIIRRKRRVEKVEKEDGDEDEDEEEEEEEDMEEDDDDDDDNGVQGLPQDEYKIEDIEKLREERLDLFEDKERIAEKINELQAQSKKLEAKQNGVKAELEETEEEIQDFQSEKLSKLNQLQMSVVLKVKQIQNLRPDAEAVERWRQIREEEINGRMEMLENRETMDGNGDPALLEKQRENMVNEEDWRGYKMVRDLGKSILFTRTQLLQLINRKQVLDDERVGLHKEKKEGEKEKSVKEKEIKENEKARELREREYNEKQMLRFGNLVDLDNLEVSGPSSVVLDLQNRFQKAEKGCIARIQDAEGDFDATQRKLTTEMKNNTNFLNLIRDLGETELELDRKLNDSMKAIFVDEDEEKKRHIMDEKLKIKKLLEIQAKEIETFKTEINMYKRKGGHIYTKVTTNRRVANLNNDN